MVAKTYQSYEMIGEPYCVSGKMYQNVKNPKTGTIRKARWYSTSEYKKLYPDAVIAEASPISSRSQKDLLGFTKGYITIFKGDTYANEEWLRASIARYARWWGWYIVSSEEVPENLPFGLEPVRLAWELVGTESGDLKAETAVKQAVDSILYKESNSEFIGEIGERIEVVVTIEKTIDLEGDYGHATMHLMRDNCGNLYVWTTASKCWPVGSDHHIRGTVKDHRMYRNEKENLLTRCMEVKK